MQYVNMIWISFTCRYAVWDNLCDFLSDKEIIFCTSDLIHLRLVDNS